MGAEQLDGEPRFETFFQLTAGGIASHCVYLLAIDWDLQNAVFPEQKFIAFLIAPITICQRQTHSVNGCLDDGTGWP